MRAMFGPGFLYLARLSQLSRPEQPQPFADRQCHDIVEHMGPTIL
jgi:hypothetical protein